MQRSQPKPSEQSTETPPAWESRLWTAGLILLVTVVYLPTLNNGFVCDDDAAVENNFALRSTSGLFNIWFKPDAHDRYEPLTLTTFWAEYHLWGLTPRGYHIVNLLLHATSAVLIWRLLARLAVPGALLAAAIFAVHPVMVESVAWISERQNVLSCALALGSLLAYLRFSPPEIPKPSKARLPAPRDNRRYYALALVLYLAALLSNAVTALLPAVLLVIYAWKRDRVTLRDVVPLVPFLALGLAMACVMISIPGSFLRAEAEGDNLGLLQRLSIAGRAMWFYAGKLAWPDPLIFVYPRWTTDPRAEWQYLFPAAALAVLVGLWWAGPRIGRGPLAAVLIFAGTLAASMILFGVNPFHEPFLADRFQYHASIALIALAAATLALGGSRLASQTPWLARLAVVGMLVPLALVAHQRTRTYRDSATLWENTIAQNPASWTAEQNLGTVLDTVQRKPDKAIPHFRKAIELQEQRIRENPRVTDYRANLADTHARLAAAQQNAGQQDDAVASRNNAIELRETLVRENPTVAAFREALAATGRLALFNDFRASWPTLRDTEQSDRATRKLVPRAASSELPGMPSPAASQILPRHNTRTDGQPMQRPRTAGQSSCVKSWCKTFPRSTNIAIARPQAMWTLDYCRPRECRRGWPGNPVTGILRIRCSCNSMALAKMRNPFVGFSLDRIEHRAEILFGRPTRRVLGDGILPEVAESR